MTENKIYQKENVGVQKMAGKIKVIYSWMISMTISKKCVNKIFKVLTNEYNFEY